MSDTLTRLVQSVYDHALANYDEGWDMVVETMGEVEIAEIIKGCRSVNGAVKRLQFHVDLWVERQANADVPEALRELELGRQDAEREVYEGLAPEAIDELPNPAGSELPGLTVEGVVCGACTSEAHRPGTTRLQARHASVAAVRLCAQLRANEAASDLEFQAAAKAERDYERYLERGGRHAEAISAELEDERRREQYAQ